MGKEYRISRRIGVGGMAEVFLAMQRSLGGFEKIVVVKRIFEHLSEDDQFVSMFLEEARLAASLRHPNIVQIFDIDRDDSGYFIVMEYLPGESLADLFDDLRGRGEAIPIPIACRVGAAVASGLHSAHTSTDGEGQPQLIVHRDVTPSNVIVGYDGVTRLVDFGVAKARSRSGQTQAGFIKGKMSYLAPEQVEEDPVDARTDVFQLGIVMHELVTGQRLFRGDNDLERMSAVITQRIPAPSSINPAVPPGLDAIILRALERDPDSRTGSADELRRNLETLLREMGQPITDSEVGEWLQGAFPDRREARVQLERSCMNEAKNQTGERIEIGSSAVHSVPVAPSPPAAGGSQGSQATPTMATVLQRPRTGTRAGQPPRRWPALAVRGGAFAAAFAAAFAIASLVGTQLAGDGDREPTAATRSATAPASSAPATRHDAAPAADTDPDERAAAAGDEPPPDAGPEAAETFQVAVATVPERAAIEIDGEDAGTGSLFRTFEIDGTTHELRVSADGYRERVVTFSDEAPPTVIRLSRISRAAPDEEPRDRAGGDRDDPPGGDSDRSGDPEPGDDDSRHPRTDNLDPWAN